MKRKHSQVRADNEEEKLEEPFDWNKSERIFYKAPGKSSKSKKRGPDIKIYYFRMYGRPTPLKMLLSHHGLDYEDIMLSPSEFEKLRDEGLFEFDQVPVLEMDGERYP